MYWPHCNCPEAPAGRGSSAVAGLAVYLMIAVASHANAVLALENRSLQAYVPRVTALESTDERVWISAIGNDRTETLWQMLNRHEPQQLLAVTADNGKSALMVASKKGDLPLVKALVAAGANIEDKTLTNGNAFMFAVLGNHKSVAEWLLIRGADIHVVGSNGWTALTLAAAKGYVELLQWLIDRGADTEVRDVYRYTPLMRAVENGRHSAARILLAQKGTDINAQDEYENTSLHHAVVAQDVPMVRLLLQHGAAADIANRDGATASILAVDKPVMRALLP